jgi:hypothetical protein
MDERNKQKKLEEKERRNQEKEKSIKEKGSNDIEKAKRDKMKDMQKYIKKITGETHNIDNIKILYNCGEQNHIFFDKNNPEYFINNLPNCGIAYWTSILNNIKNKIPGVPGAPVLNYFGAPPVGAPGGHGPPVPGVHPVPPVTPGPGVPLGAVPAPAPGASGPGGVPAPGVPAPAPGAVPASGAPGPQNPNMFGMIPKPLNVIRVHILGST